MDLSHSKQDRSPRHRIALKLLPPNQCLSMVFFFLEFELYVKALLLMMMASPCWLGCLKNHKNEGTSKYVGLTLMREHVKKEDARTCMATECVVGCPCTLTPCVSLKFFA